MARIRITTVGLALCLCGAMQSSRAFAQNICALDSLNETLVIRSTSDFTAGAIVGLNGWLSSDTAVVVLHGTAVVSADGTTLKILLQGINNVQHKYLGLVVDSDLMLNGSGSFENMTAARPFTYEILPVTWTNLDPCPDGPPFGARLARSQNKPG